MHAVLVVTLALLPLSRFYAGGLETPQGVGPAQEERYRRLDTVVIDGVEKLKCSGDPETLLPLEAFNDDYCDCADGSDEPSTGACGGFAAESATEVLFYCPNNNSQPKYVYHSRVNDGVCDCCDGSDEQRPRSPIYCQDTCWQEGAADREAERVRQETWKKGSQLQQQLVEATEAKLEEWRVEMTMLQEKLPMLKSDREDKKRVLDEAKSRLPPDPVPTPAPETTTAPPPPPPPPPSPEEVAWQEALSAVEAAKLKLQDLEAKLDPLLVGGHRALANLGGQCLNHKPRSEPKFEYKICFFQHAYQSTDTEKDVLLGRWAGWESGGDVPVRAVFKDGQKCGDGKARSLTVRLECGGKVKLKSVAEPSSCEYEAAVYHPGGCESRNTPKNESRVDAWKAVLALQAEEAEAAEKLVESWRSEAEQLRADIVALEKEADEKKKLAEAPPQEDNNDKPQVSEYAKWMETETLADDKREEAKTEAADPATADASGGVASTATEAAGEEAVEESKKEEENLRAAFDLAQESWSASDAEFWKVKYRLKGLEVGLDPRLTGRLRSFASLEGQCLERSFDDSRRYKVCFFRTAQAWLPKDEVSLGRWIGWDFQSSPIRGRFERGSSCEADGVSNLRRSLLATFKCGHEVQIESVEKRPACALHMEVTHPGACDPETPPEVKKLPPRWPKDEL